MLEMCLQIFLCTVQESLRLHVGGAKGQEVDGSEPGLLARGDKDDDRHFWRVLADGLVDRFHHCYQSRWCVSGVKPLQWWYIHTHTYMHNTCRYMYIQI